MSEIARWLQRMYAYWSNEYTPDEWNVEDYYVMWCDNENHKDFDFSTP